MAENNENDRAPPEASSRITPSTVAVEEAETDIKEAAKDAALNAIGESAYYKRVLDILKKRLAKIANPRLRDGALQSLLRFARKQYEEEQKLLKLYAEWFKVVSEAKARRLPNATPLYNAMIKEVGSVKEAIGFKLEVVGGGEPLIVSNPTLRSEDMTADPEISLAAYNTALPLKENHNWYLERVENVKAELIDSGAKALYDEGVSLRNIAEMTVRYDHQKQMIADLRDGGTKLVYIEPHANCSKRCEKYQVGGSKHPSGLYSLDGSSGVTPEDGVPYRPLEFATNNPEDRYTTSEGKTYQNGCILGYNCRHRLIPYKPNIQPIPIPASVIKKTREIETTQREMEREIRQMRGTLLQATNAAEGKKLRGEIKKAEERYIAFSRKNDMTYYIRRTEIF